MSSLQQRVRFRTDLLGSRARHPTRNIGQYFVHMDTKDALDALKQGYRPCCIISLRYIADELELMENQNGRSPGWTF